MEFVFVFLNAGNGFMGFYGFPGMFYRMDPTYSLVVIGAVICMIASANVSRSFSKYSRYGCKRGTTGAQAAEKILHDAGIYDVQIRHISGDLTDNYNPGNKTLNLSDSVYGSSSIAAVGVAAHECGHAIQDKTGYTFLRIRKAMVPLVNIANYAGYVSILIGAIFSLLDLIWIGIALEAIILLFQLVTLPVEFDAAKRALNQVEELGILDNNELKYGKKMLVSAALTYVAGAATAMLQILRLILIFGGRRDD